MRNRPVGPVQFVGSNDDGVAQFVDVNGVVCNGLALYRRTFDPPPVGGPGGLASQWCDDAYRQADAAGASICGMRDRAIP
jgi:hypothetical protein